MCALVQLPLHAKGYTQTLAARIRLAAHSLRTAAPHLTWASVIVVEAGVVAGALEVVAIEAVSLGIILGPFPGQWPAASAVLMPIPL